MLRLVPASPCSETGDPTGIRTPVATVKGWCPRPLDDRVKTLGTALRSALVSSNQTSNLQLDTIDGGGKRDRTADLLHAMQALSQLSYTPLGVEPQIIA